MTLSLIEKSEIESRFMHCETLGEVITNLERELQKKGEVICEIHVNGVRLAEQDEIALASKNRREISRLMIQTSHPESLIRQALVSAHGLLPQLQEACVTTADAFRSGENERAQLRLNETLEGCTWFIDTLVHIRGASKNTETSFTEPAQWSLSEKKLEGIVREILAAFERRDSVLLADLMEYELGSVLSEWVPVLEKQIQETPAPGHS